MPKHAESRHLPYTPQQMFHLVSDVAAYPEFLPWNSAARIRSKILHENGNEMIEADLIISFKVFRESFTSRVTLWPDYRRIDTTYINGPFRYLQAEWRFSPADRGTDIDFTVDFEFKSAILQSIIGLVFDEAMQRIVGAFERRAHMLYSAKA